MGNGPVASGDGWKFRGRGFIQLTGKDNYTKCGKSIGADLLANPDYLITLEGAFKSALWFWNANGLNAFADKGDILGMTKKINGGTIGLEERKAHYEKALKLLSSGK
jgi:putative chitinase